MLSPRAGTISHFYYSSKSKSRPLPGWGGGRWFTLTGALAYRTLVEIDNNETISGYRASIDTTGQRGRPSFEIGEEQLSYLLEQGFNVRDIGSILGVSVRTVERRMSSFGLTVSGKKLYTVLDMVSFVLYNIKQ
jgi:hypothetical protein